VEKVYPVVRGKYRILALIERHWYADEHLCIDEKRNKNWAILAYRREMFPEQSFHQFLKDIKRFQSLDHPALPRIEEIIVEEEYFYLVRELIEGISLKKKVESEGHGKYDLVEFTDKLCSCLSYLNSQEEPIILKNLKPSNIWIRPSGELAISALDEPRCASEFCANTYFTGFAAPEVAFDAQCDCRTDIFSVGAILFYCMTGRRISDGSGVPPEEMLSQFWTTGLRCAVIKCISPQPENRILDYEELLWRIGIRQTPPVRIRKRFSYQIGRLYWKYKFVPVLGRILFTCHMISNDGWKEYKRMQRNHSNVG